MSNIVPLASRSKVPESEKVTINLGFVDLGHIDLLVSEGFYANRTDFIRTAILVAFPVLAQSLHHATNFS